MNSETKKIGISDLKLILKGIQDTYNMDFSVFSLPFFKRRIERIYELFNFFSVNDFIDKIITNKSFFEIFLFEISVPTTEMFRDPTMWTALKHHLHKYSKQEQIKVWLPEITSDEELFSLIILLKEISLLEKTTIYATSYSEKYLKQANTGIISIKKYEINSANFQRYNKNIDFSQFITKNKKNAILDSSLFANVHFLQNSFLTNNIIDINFDIILFRNRMLQYKIDFQFKVLEQIDNRLNKGGMLIIGVNESLNNWKLAKKYKIVEKNENIFKKK